MSVVVGRKLCQVSISQWSHTVCVNSSRHRPGHLLQRVRQHCVGASLILGDSFFYLLLRACRCPRARATSSPSETPISPSTDAMFTCDTCEATLRFPSAFSRPDLHPQKGLSLLLEPSSTAVSLPSASHFPSPAGVPTAHAAYRQSFASGPGCLTLGVANGVRGGLLGCGFGVFFGLTSLPAGTPAPVALTHVARSAARNGAGFAAWTSMFHTTRCVLAKARRRNDIINPALAGFLTGGVLSLAAMPRGSWRYSQHTLLMNASGSAIIACVFEMI